MVRVGGDISNAQLVRLTRFLSLRFSRSSLSVKVIFDPSSDHARSLPAVIVTVLDPSVSVMKMMHTASQLKNLPQQLSIPILHSTFRAAAAQCRPALEVVIPVVAWMGRPREC